MPTIPCPLCGYHAPLEVCPHCGGTASLPSLARPTHGPVRGVADGLLAVPVGLWLLATTRGVKRWLVPPLLVTLAVLVVLLWAVFEWVASVLPDHVGLGDSRWERLEALSDRWSWLKAAWAASVAALGWTLDAAYQMLTARPLYWLGAFLLGSLVAWYAFSIVYEALAGPFLDEVQGRFEARWFGADPRSRLQRPSDIPESRCWRRTLAASAGAAALLLLGFFVPGVPFLLGLAAAPLPFVLAARLDREYGAWLRWMIGVEARATWVSLETAAVTGVLLVLALPLYFLPFGVGYVLFAGAAGLATAVGLLDIPFERRDIRLRQRLAFLLRNALPMLAFGAMAGLLLSIPILGPLLMVPSASIGGLWLLCRLDKGSLRPRREVPPPASLGSLQRLP